MSFVSYIDIIKQSIEENSMITQQSLRRDVLDYLRKKFSIKLQLPSFKRHVSDKINLKIFKSPLGQHFTQNRYRILINLIEDLLKRNIINTQKIKEFGECFFQTINQDLSVLQNNEQIRRNFTKIRDQITYRIEELTVEQAKMEQQCKMISDKEDILIFLEGSFKTYLSNVKVVSDHYDGINGAQVYTSINIDNIYNQKLAQEEDYIQHYQPLLEVMQRLKSNMLKLYQELNRCEYYELPLKSVNFLANCKNLLLQLEPFLIKPDCVFNRLIFHVTRGQKQNNRLISNVFKSNIAFTNDIVSDIFKSFFLAYIFQDSYYDIKEKIQNQRVELINVFEQKQTNIDNFNNFNYKLEKKSQDIKNQILSLRKIIGLGKDKIMREYLGRKQCKKGNMLTQLQQREYKIRMLGNTMQQFIKYRNRVQYLGEKGREVEGHVSVTINQLKQLEQNNIKTSKPLNSNIKEMELRLHQRIKESYLMIQQGAISIRSLLKTLQQSREEHADAYFNENYFPKQQTLLSDLLTKYKDYEITLLNHYQNLRQQKLQKGEQTRQLKSSILQQLNEYFQTKISGEMGYEVRNEDEQCQLVKDNIIKIQKMEFMINNYISNPNPTELQELKMYKINLQWLLQVFQGSMDEQIFERFIERLNFDGQDWQEQSKRVRQLIKQLNRYVSLLKSIMKSNNISKINQKVFKLVKNRTQLYQIFQDLYEEFNTIFETCKQKNHLNIGDHGLKIFDQPTYQYVLMLYQYKNRMRAQIQEIKDLLLPKKTINYLIDELYQPFLNSFNNFSTYNEQELLNFTLRLEHALNIKTSHAEITKLFEQTLSKPYHKDFFQSVNKISAQVAQLKVENNKVLDLEQEEVMIYNLNEFKAKIQLIKEHIFFAETIVEEIDNKQLVLEIQFNNKQLNLLRTKLIKDWAQYQKENPSHQMEDDFQQH